ncbi:DNA-binding protein [Actinomadura violacea]|uniref:DNA-binding protein n=1 Tax=Actinomadura violacea TaxID=2819934 RepID=A0ABS3RNT7_9ACTN|nr:DNA-binding protein [Actinomadura violacea]MBO2458286.1 DNA-binding protein [Actinomadura violacea]
MEDAEADHGQAAREAEARKRLLDSGASSLPRAPWLHGSQPPSAVDLIHFALWRGNAGDLDERAVMAALALLPAARAEMDQVEAALMFTARAQGLSWPQISRAMGLASAQAAQQRFGRVSGRVENRREGA